MQFSHTSDKQLKNDVFSRRLKMDSDGKTVTSDGKLFQMRASATLKAWPSTVTRHVGGMFSSSVKADMLELDSLWHA